MRAAAALILAAIAAVLILNASSEEPRASALQPDATAFWTSREKTLTIAPNGARLRIAIDHENEGQPVTANISGPSSGTAEVREGLYSAEWTVDKPPAGTYRIRVRGPGPFRLRAKLERTIPRPKDTRPNLRPLPPYDLTFLEPITNGRGGGIPRGRQGGDGCHAEETAEGAKRCLRMAFGVVNAGDGPFSVFYRDARPGQDRPLFQRIHRPDGSTRVRSAGIAYWHASHDHYHQDHAIAIELLDTTGRRVKPLRKKGFAHRDELLREWRRFHPIAGRAGSDFGLLAGWADYYEWDRPGNYVDVSGVKDGRYVLRMTADPDRHITESDEDDNVAYSLIELRGRRGRVLESGLGTGPGVGCRARLPIGPEPAPDRRACR